MPQPITILPIEEYGKEFLEKYPEYANRPEVFSNYLHSRIKKVVNQHNALVEEAEQLHQELDSKKDYVDPLVLKTAAEQQAALENKVKGLETELHKREESIAEYEKTIGDLSAGLNKRESYISPDTFNQEIKKHEESAAKMKEEIEAKMGEEISIVRGRAETAENKIKLVKAEHKKTIARLEEEKKTMQETGGYDEKFNFVSVEHGSFRELTLLLEILGRDLRYHEGIESYKVMSQKRPVEERQVTEISVKKKAGSKFYSKKLMDSIANRKEVSYTKDEYEELLNAVGRESPEGRYLQGKVIPRGFWFWKRFEMTIPEYILDKVKPPQEEPSFNMRCKPKEPEKEKPLKPKAAKPVYSRTKVQRGVLIIPAPPPISLPKSEKKEPEKSPVDEKQLKKDVDRYLINLQKKPEDVRKSINEKAKSLGLSMKEFAYKQLRDQYENPNPPAQKPNTDESPYGKKPRSYDSYQPIWDEESKAKTPGTTPMIEDSEIKKFDYSSGEKPVKGAKTSETNEGKKIQN